MPLGRKARSHDVYVSPFDTEEKITLFTIVVVVCYRKLTRQTEVATKWLKWLNHRTHAPKFVFVSSSPFDVNICKNSSLPT